jgi:hypothetical protein
MTPEDRLSAFLKADASPVRDVVFETQVMRRVAGRELATTLMTAAVMALAGGVVLWACAPMLSAVVEPLARMLAPVAAGLGIAVTVVLLAQGLLRRV